MVIVVGLVGGCAVYQSSAKTVTFTVQDKVVKNDSGSSKYLIFTNHGVFKDTDSFAFFKFNSSDVYGQLEKGHTYRCKVAGWRVHVASAYPNIISCSEVAR